MKIAILASGKGDKALYLHDFFKEGNRIEIVAVITDSSDSPFTATLKSEGVEIIFLTAETSLGDVAEHLKSLDVEMLVDDDLTGYAPQELKERLGVPLVYLSSCERAPIEVIEAGKQINPAPTVHPLPKPQETSSEEPVPAPDNEAKQPKIDATPIEKEWAETLNVDLSRKQEPETGAKEEVQADGPTQTPPPAPQYPEPPQYPDRQQYPGQPQYPEPQQIPEQPQYPGQPQYPDRQQYPYPQERMPETYLVWSVLATILCCLIPGIVAIIYSSMVSSKFYAGNIEGAKRASKNAQIWVIVSVILGIVWMTLYIPLMLLAS